jgi:hypothetical protein
MVVKQSALGLFFLISKGILGSGLNEKENQRLFAKVVRINVLPTFLWTAKE